MPDLTITIRTVDRSPLPNYLGQTVRSLIASGTPAAALHVVLTDPDLRWLDDELEGLPVVLHAPTYRRTPNANGLAEVRVLDLAPADWLLMLEDDVVVCGDFAASVQRWLGHYAHRECHVYRFCAFGTMGAQVGTHARLAPLREQRGSQAIALRSEDALDLAIWADSRGDRWRPPQAPFQSHPSTGFDKMVGYWALDRWPGQPYGLVSRPHFVHHVGSHSWIHRATVLNDAAFAGSSWAYDRPVLS